MNACTDVRELIPWYVNGSLSVEEARHVAAHLLQCDACREELTQTMLLNVELCAAFDAIEGLQQDVKTNVLERTSGKALAQLDVGSFLLGFSFGVSYQRRRIPMRGDLRVLGRRIRLFSPDEEEK